MGHQFAQIAFTPSVREVQARQGSRAGYAALDEGEDFNNEIGEQEAAFIAARDSFYMASVGETGWPYVQHRGGPAGFIKVLDSHTLGFADYSGNRQYITTGNLTKDNRVSLFFMDYPNRRRLKLLGRIEVVGMEQPEWIAKLEDGDYRARIERGMIIRVEAYDWNCPQHITPRYSEEELEDQIDQQLQPLRDEVRILKAGKNSPTNTENSTQLTTKIPLLGEGELELVVTGIRQLTPRVRAYELRSGNAELLPLVHAGAHLAMPVVLANGEHVIRHYSIASNPARRDIYEVAVLLEPEGKGGSQALQATYQLGTRIRVPLPSNHFSLHDDNRAAVLIAGGIGITPIKTMAQALAERGNRFELHYTGRSRDEMPFCDRLQKALGDRMRAYPADESKRLDIESIVNSAPADSVFYVCGPAKLLSAVMTVAERHGIEPERMRFERFEAEHRLQDQPLQVHLARSNRSLHIAAEETILDALLRAGVPAPHSCRTGQCRSCAVKVLDGEADHRDDALSDSERQQQRLMCPCVSRATTNMLTLDL